MLLTQAKQSAEPAKKESMRLIQQLLTSMNHLSAQCKKLKRRAELSKSTSIKATDQADQADQADQEKAFAIIEKLQERIELIKNINKLKDYKPWEIATKIKSITSLITSFLNDLKTNLEICLDKNFCTPIDSGSFSIQATEIYIAHINKHAELFTNFLTQFQKDFSSELAVLYTFNPQIKTTLSDILTHIDDTKKQLPDLLKTLASSKKSTNTTRANQDKTPTATAVPVADVIINANPLDVPQKNSQQLPNNLSDLSIQKEECQEKLKQIEEAGGETYQKFEKLIAQRKALDLFQNAQSFNDIKSFSTFTQCSDKFQHVINEKSNFLQPTWTETFSSFFQSPQIYVQQEKDRLDNAQTDLDKTISKLTQKRNTLLTKIERCDAKIKEIEIFNTKKNDLSTLLTEAIQRAKTSSSLWTTRTLQKREALEAHRVKVDNAHTIEEINQLLPAITATLAIQRNLSFSTTGANKLATLTTLWQSEKPLSINKSPVSEDTLPSYTPLVVN